MSVYQLYNNNYQLLPTATNQHCLRLASKASYPWHGTCFLWGLPRVMCVLTTIIITTLPIATTATIPTSAYVNSDTYPILESCLHTLTALPEACLKGFFCSCHAEVKTTRCYRQIDKLGKHCCSFCQSCRLPSHCEACKSLQLRGLPQRCVLKSTSIHVRLQKPNIKYDFS